MGLERCWVYLIATTTAPTWWLFHLRARPCSRVSADRRLQVRSAIRWEYVGDEGNERRLRTAPRRSLSAGDNLLTGDIWTLTRTHTHARTHTHTHIHTHTPTHDAPWRIVRGSVASLTSEIAKLNGHSEADGRRTVWNSFIPFSPLPKPFLNYKNQGIVADPVGTWIEFQKHF